MLTVTKFVTRTFDLDYIDLYWEIADFARAQDVITAYEFSILRSEGSEGPWDPISPIFKDQYHFRDFSPNLLHKWRRLFYKLKITHLPTSEELITDSVSLVAEPDLIALEIQRQEDTLLRQWTGRRCWLFPVRTFGAKCACFDTTMGRRTTSNCLMCFDTGYIGGFLTPIECFVQIDPDRNKEANTPAQGTQQPKITTARLIAFPPMKPKDIIVEPENRRWRIDTVTSTERLRASVRQELSLWEIQRGDIEYKLPINLQDLANQQYAEERNFTNPQHVNDQEGTVDDLLAIFTGGPRRTS